MADLNLITYASSQKPNIQYVSQNSNEYRTFIKRIEHNFTTKQYKLSACLFCWGFLTPCQKKRHLEHTAYLITPSQFKDEGNFLQLCKINGKYIQNKNSDIKVAIFNEQCLNVDYSVFGEPNNGEQPPKTNYDSFKPRQVHAWLTKRGSPVDDNPHTSENSGIPIAKIKNASLKEMLNRMEYQQKVQDRTNQRFMTEIQLLQEENQDLRLKLTNQEHALQTIVQCLVQGNLTDSESIKNQLKSVLNNRKQRNRNQIEEEEITFREDRLAITECEQQQVEDKVVPSTIYQKEEQWVCLNPEDSPLSDLGNDDQQ